MRKKKAKFRVGQVVQVGTTGQYRRITAMDASECAYLNGSAMWKGFMTAIFGFEDLRPLTAREIGKRKQS